MMRRVYADFDMQIPPRRSRFLRWVGIFYLWLRGWKMVGTIPNIPKMVLIAAPHTSNWDGVNLIMAIFVARADCKWMIKEEFVRGPVGWFVRWTGGVPIKRDGSMNVVAQSVDQLKNADEMLLLIAPEGTRKKASYWKTGFYWIAHQAGVPLLFTKMDYGTKTMYFTGPIEASGDLQTDIETIWDAYRDITPLHPEKLSDMRLRERDIKRFEARDSADEPG